MTKSTRWRDEEKLRSLVEQGYSRGEMAEELGCSTSTITRWLVRHGIEHRVEQNESGPQHPRWKPEAEFGTHSMGYEYWRIWDGESMLGIGVHRVLAIAKYGPEAVKDKDVHHPNGLKWDNRPENIELRDKDEHAREHMRERDRDTETGRLM